MKRWRISYLVLAAVAILAIAGCNDDNNGTGTNVEPPVPHDPIPADNAVNQDLRVRLEWSAFDPDGDLTDYKIYLDTLNPPTYDTTVNTYLYSHSNNRFEFNTTYYWQIIANDRHHPDVVGPIWRFTTGNLYQVDLWDTQNALKIFVNDDSLVFVADDGAGMKIFMVTDTSQVGQRIDSVGAISSTGFNNDIYESAGVAYMATNNGLNIYDVSNPAIPVVIRLLQVPVYSPSEDVRAVNVIGNYAYTASVMLAANPANDTGYVRILNISDPADTVLQEGSIAFQGIGQDIYVVGNYAYVADSLNGLRIFDISDETNPTLESTLATNDRAIAVFAVGTTVYIADGSAGLTIVDASNPASPSIVGNIDMPDYARDVYVRDNYAYVADYAHGGLQIANVTTPSAPVIVASRLTLGGAAGVFVDDHYVYFGDKFNGLIVYEFQPAN